MWAFLLFLVNISRSESICSNISSRSLSSCSLYQKYAKLAEKEENVIFGGRLGEYKYYDMDKVIESAMKKAEEIF